MSIKTKVMTSKVGRKFAMNKPEIYFGIGIACGVGAIGASFYAGTKAKHILETSKKEIEEVRYVWEEKDLPEDVYSEKDHQKDLVIAYGRAVGRAAKVIVPVAVLADLSFAFLLKSNRIHKMRATALGLAYTGLSEQFGKYRERVVAEHGEEADRMYAHGLVKKDIEIEETNAKGEPKTKKVKGAIIGNDGEEYSQYAKYFDEGCRNWSKNPEDNLVFLKSQERYANDILNTRGHIFLNDVYEALGIPKTEAGQYVGWMLGNGNDYVDFGIYDIYKETNRDFVNGYEPVLLLDFNVDGVISNKL